jgi:hypothetical protein
MRLFHRTWAIIARDILETGFSDGDAGFVWLADAPLEAVDIKGGDSGDISLVIDVPKDVADAFPIQQRNGYRAFQIPAEQLNLCGKPWTYTTNYGGMTRRELLHRVEMQELAEAGQAPIPGAATTFGSAESLRQALSFLDDFLLYP